MNDTKPIIFIISDNVSMLQEMTNTLEDLYCDFYSFMSPENLLAHKLLKTIDLFIIDMDLKAIDGRALYNKARVLNTNSPVLFVSDELDDISFDIINCDCVYDFIPKSFPSKKFFVNRVKFLLRFTTRLNKMNEEKDRITNLFEAVLEQAPFGIDVIEKNGKWRIVKSSNKSKEITGDSYLESMSDLSYSSCKFNVYTLDGELVETKDLPGVKSFLYGECIDNEELVVVRDNGEKSYVSFKAVPVKNKNGVIIAGLQISYDITERKVKENKLRKDFEERINRWNDDIDKVNSRSWFHLNELNGAVEKIEARSV